MTTKTKTKKEEDRQRRIEGDAVAPVEAVIVTAETQSIKIGARTNALPMTRKQTSKKQTEKYRSNSPMLVRETWKQSCC